MNHAISNLNTFIDCSENLTNIDSLNIVNSYRIYSGKPIDNNDQLHSYAIFNLDLSKTSNDLSCTSDNFSSAKIELSLFNQLKDEEFNDETEIDEVLEYYVDESGIRYIFRSLEYRLEQFIKLIFRRFY